MSITEAHGEWRTGINQLYGHISIIIKLTLIFLCIPAGITEKGKTQLAHTLCISAQLPNDENRFSGGKVIFIDTEGTFRPERLRPICERFSIDYHAAMDNIFYYRANTSDQQIEALTMAAALLSQEPTVFKLLIIDSIMALMRVDYMVIISSYIYKSSCPSLEHSLSCVS